MPLPQVWYYSAEKLNLIFCVYTMYQYISRRRLISCISFLFLATMSTALLLRSYLARPLGVGLASHLLLVHNNKARCDHSRLSSTSCTSVDLNESNPLLDQKSVPRFDKILPAHVVPAVQHDLQRLQTDFKCEYYFYLNVVSAYIISCL